MEIGAPAPFLAEHLNLLGPAYTVSTACTSGAKALASARNLIRSGLVDAVIAGGVDTLCQLTLRGKSTALESTTAELTNPLSANRQGINIGEGAALFIVSAPSPARSNCSASANPATPTTCPRPNLKASAPNWRYAPCWLTLGLRRKTSATSTSARHATRKNDEMESRLVARVFPAGVRQAVPSRSPATLLAPLAPSRPPSAGWR